MRKSVIALLMATSLVAAAEKPFVVLKAGKRVTADKVTADSSGNLNVVKGSVSRQIKKSAYKYARVPITQAPEVVRMIKAWRKKKYSDVATMFQAAYQKYRYLGWGSACIYLAADSLNRLNKKSAALARLDMLKTPTDPLEMKDYYKALRLQATLCVDANKPDKALNVLSKLGASPDPSAAAFAYNTRGDILLKQGKSTKDALLKYLTTALLFDKSNKKERPEALFKIIKMLRAEKNNKAQEFEKMLRRDYPDSKYLKSL